MHGQQLHSQHAMCQVIDASDRKAILLVDASNAFNSLNRQAALRNIHQRCPALSKILINTYREDVQLFIDGEVLLSQEGTTQGGPLGMTMYAVAITPLIHLSKTERLGRCGLLMMPQQVISFDPWADSAPIKAGNQLVPCTL